MLYYAVKNGKTTGIYDKWEDCRAQVDKFKNACYKKCNTLREAENFIGKALIIEKKTEVESCKYCFSTIDETTQNLECQGQCGLKMHTDCITNNYSISKGQVDMFAVTFKCYKCIFDGACNNESVSAEKISGNLENMVETYRCNDKSDFGATGLDDDTVISKDNNKSSIIIDQKLGEEIGLKVMSNEGGNNPAASLREEEDSIKNLYLGQKHTSNKNDQRVNLTKMNEQNDINFNQWDTVRVKGSLSSVNKSDVIVDQSYSPTSKIEKQYSTKYYYNTNRLFKLKKFYVGNLDSNWTLEKLVDILICYLKKGEFGCYKLKSSNKTKTAFCIESTELTLSKITKMTGWPTYCKIRIFGGDLSLNVIESSYKSTIRDELEKSRSENGHYNSPAIKTANNLLLTNDKLASQLLLANKMTGNTKTNTSVIVSKKYLEINFNDQIKGTYVFMEIDNEGVDANNIGREQRIYIVVLTRFDPSSGYIKSMNVAAFLTEIKVDQFYALGESLSGKLGSSFDGDKFFRNESEQNLISGRYVIKEGKYTNYIQCKQIVVSGVELQNMVNDIGYPRICINEYVDNVVSNKYSFEEKEISDVLPYTPEGDKSAELQNLNSSSIEHPVIKIDCADSQRNIALFNKKVNKDKEVSKCLNEGQQPRFSSFGRKIKQNSKHL